MKGRFLFLLFFTCYFNIVLKSQSINNCFILHPVFEVSDDMEPNLKLDTVSEISKNQNKLDPSVAFVTNFEYQKQIIIDYNCFNNNQFENIENSFLKEIVNSSCGSPNPIISNLRLVKKGVKNILNLGLVNIFEYEFTTDEQTPNHFIIIVPIIENDTGIDYNGIVLFSYGFNWYKLTNQSEEVCSIIYNIRRNKKLEILLNFTKNHPNSKINSFYIGRFIPIGNKVYGGWGD